MCSSSLGKIFLLGGKVSFGLNWWSQELSLLKHSWWMPGGLPGSIGEGAYVRGVVLLIGSSFTYVEELMY